MFQGTLEGIFIGPVKAAPMQRIESARAIAGEGLEGDRYACRNGTFSGYKATGTAAQYHPQDKQVTLIEIEAIEAAAADYEVAVDPAQSRRNLLVRGVPLNHLVGKEFTIGRVRLRGLCLCEPCGHLEKLTVPGIKTALLHRGGLRAEILENGILQLGDVVRSITS